MLFYPNILILSTAEQNDLILSSVCKEHKNYGINIKTVVSYVCIWIILKYKFCVSKKA